MNEKRSATEADIERMMDWLAEKGVANIYETIGDEDLGNNVWFYMRILLRYSFRIFGNEEPAFAALYGVLFDLEETPVPGCIGQSFLSGLFHNGCEYSETKTFRGHSG
jgi:hypothetical protein